MRRGIPSKHLWAGVRVLLATAMFGALSDAAARAQPSAAEAANQDAEYQALIADAVREFEGQHYEESRALFQRAHTLAPSARTYRGLALTEFELRDYVACATHLEAALASNIKPLTPELRADTERLLARTQTFVAHILITSTPNNAEIVVDGLVVAEANGKRLPLTVGTHRLEARARGFIGVNRTLQIMAGQDQTIQLELAPVHDKTEIAKKPWFKNPWLWTAVGVVVVGAAAGAGYAVAQDPPQASGGTANLLLKGP